MQPVRCFPNRDRGYRVGDYISIAKTYLYVDQAQGQAKNLFNGIKQFLCIGYLPINDDGEMCPLKNHDSQRDTSGILILFVLKKYGSKVSMTFTDETLEFQRGASDEQTE